MTLNELLPKVIGITKKEIAIILDRNNPLFNFNTEYGLTSYNNYTRNELIEIAIKIEIDIISDYHKKRSSIKSLKNY